MLTGVAHAAATGVAVSPDRTSVEADFSQVFSARFLTASGQPSVGETVQFSNDACGRFPNGQFGATTTTDANGVASMTFTALSLGGTVCAVVAAAGAQVRFQVYTYRQSQIAYYAPLPSGFLQPGQSFTLPVEVRMGVYALPNLDLRASVVAGTGMASVSPGSVNTGSSGHVDLTVTPTSLGDYEIELSVGTFTRRVAVHYVGTVDPWHQDLWWSGPGENGWGLTIVEHRNLLFVLLYTYDANGQPTWYVAPAGYWDFMGAVWVASLYSPRGTPFFSYDANRFTVGPSVGSISIAFSGSRDHATLFYTINGVSGQKAISRFAFGPAAQAPMTGRTDMWWGGMAQNGWGIAVIQQNASLFTMWYTYDAAGNPLWYAMPSGTWTSSDTYEGRVYRTTGSPWLGGAYDASLFRPVDVGSYRLRFSGETATFEYSVDGRTGTLPLTRTPF
jgi:hypothetical protein